MRRVVELEIRLAYHDRIMQTLPDAMLEKGQGVISDQPPEPSWRFSAEGR
jgi:nuclear cap-binding protein subunit 1